MSILLLLQEWEQASPAMNKLLAGVWLQLDGETQTIVQNLSEAGKLKLPTVVTAGGTQRAVLRPFWQVVLGVRVD
jgi:hypothetical protein